MLNACATVVQERGECVAEKASREEAHAPGEDVSTP
ncbi:hypothetical protein Mal4_18710 [Maioricimonas rarisocia]|uniref:Uncharacterized protein n=1 Tax=Maioricimonas rarisocia TaxID=2528026 RepID=A0A517Z534_9PLAN|nr:hypothetical protein Mal4_18710 [Maioricimonas rarisocia]